MHIMQNTPNQPAIGPLQHAAPPVLRPTCAEHTPKPPAGAGDDGRDFAQAGAPATGCCNGACCAGTESTLTPATWPGRAVGIRAPDKDETPLSHAEVLHAARHAKELLSANAWQLAELDTEPPVRRRVGAGA